MSFINPTQLENKNTNDRLLKHDLLFHDMFVNEYSIALAEFVKIPSNNNIKINPVKYLTSNSSKTIINLHLRARHK
ncbi:TPA: exotoxin OB-fold domain-containing protein [Staphylococcus aureus]